MTATISIAALPGVVLSRAIARTARRVATLAVACAFATGCVTGSDDSTRPSNQMAGTFLGAALGGTVGGLAFGSVGGAVGGALVGALAGNLVGRALDNQERQRLAEATRRAYVAESDEPVVYTVEPGVRSSTPAPAASSAPPPAPAATVVSAKPAGPKTVQPDGGSCRPIELTATKNGQTTRETTTFCQAAGSNDLKPVSV